MPNKKSQILIIGALGLAAIYFFTQKKNSVDVDVPDFGGGSDNYSDSPSQQTTGSDVIAAQGALGREAYNNLIRYDPYNAARVAAYKKMNDQELIDSFDYVWSYMLRGKKLYQYPGATGIYADGGWNTRLYNAIAAIKSKYGIF